MVDHLSGRALCGTTGVLVHPQAVEHGEEVRYQPILAEWTVLMAARSQASASVCRSCLQHGLGGDQQPGTDPALYRDRPQGMYYYDDALRHGESEETHPSQTAVHGL